MARRKPSGSLGVKYGFTLRRRSADVMARRRLKYKCSNCARGFLKRVGVGIWTCKKCGHTFAGGAYEPHTKSGLTSVRVSGLTSAKRAES